ncbi:hypothetical protein GCM10023147_44490 [Tsukamurella soli]|uniref:Uncharacterized protein n=1 Tax=Tsukamurella soli TaxID=644556 RepID=A0ABP8KB10_9ACTN
MTSPVSVTVMETASSAGVLAMVTVPPAGVCRSALLRYTTWLNIAALALTATLTVRFVRTGGIGMLRMMGGSPPEAAPSATRERPDR